MGDGSISRADLSLQSSRACLAKRFDVSDRATFDGKPSLILNSDVATCWSSHLCQGPAAPRPAGWIEMYEK